MPEDSGQHWRNQIEVFHGFNMEQLKKLLNDFFKDKFVIATQVFPRDEKDGRLYDAIVYFKVPPVSKQ